MSISAPVTPLQSRHGREQHLIRALTPRSGNTPARTMSQTPMCSPHPFARHRDAIDPFPSLDAWLHQDADADSLSSAPHTPASVGGTPPQGCVPGVRWSIDDLAQLMPTDLEALAAQFETPDPRTMTPKHRLRLEQRRHKIQLDCDLFFHPSNRLAPSPVAAAQSRPRGRRGQRSPASTPSARSQPATLLECSGLGPDFAVRDVACQAGASCPWDLSLEDFYCRRQFRASTSPLFTGPSPAAARLADGLADAFFGPFDTEYDDHGPMCSSPNVSAVGNIRPRGSGSNSKLSFAFGAECTAADDSDDGLRRFLFGGPDTQVSKPAEVENLTTGAAPLVGGWCAPLPVIAGKSSSRVPHCSDDDFAGGEAYLGGSTDASFDTDDDAGADDSFDVLQLTAAAANLTLGPSNDCGEDSFSRSALRGAADQRDCCPGRESALVGSHQARSGLDCAPWVPAAGGNRSLDF